MKILKLLPMLLLVLLSACSDDDAATDSTLNYDGANASGPVLDIATHEAAARFPASLTAQYEGRDLEEIEYYIGQQPASAELRVYKGGTESTPGSLIYSADVTNSLKLQEFSTHLISTPIEMTAEDLWISVRLVHANNQQSIGCDAGPANANGDWLFNSTDGTWRTYRDRTGESVNWNIRGIVR